MTDLADMPPAPPVTVQCYLPTLVADTLDLTGLQFEESTRVPSDRRGQVRFTMQMDVAVTVLEQVRARGASTESGPLLLACAAAVQSLDAAIKHAIAFWQSAPGRVNAQH
ncbi:MAG: hypothetical protein ACHQWU_04995 [Gemmatimonadales bacterium]